MSDKYTRRTEYHDRIIDSLNQRETWENRQRLFYQARYFGVRRKTKPWPTAADLHVQLIDGDLRGESWWLRNNDPSNKHNGGS